MFGALDLIYLYLFILDVLNEHLMLPWDARNKLLIRILQDELGIDLEQKLLVYKMANLKVYIYLNYDIFVLSCISIAIGFAPGLNVCSRQLTA